MAVITPAVAGPFDLGTVVVRAALYVDPDTAQIHAVSATPSRPSSTASRSTCARSRVNLDRPSFTLNPTSCDPMAITGAATSVLGATAPLLQRFQVGGCPRSPFKPKLSLQLKGKTKRTAHPSLIANLTAKPGEANIARPRSSCPPPPSSTTPTSAPSAPGSSSPPTPARPASIYGTASATTPLLDYPLTGNVYLRSSTHQLPDLVADLNGPATQPIEIALAGKTDSVKGALRNTFEAVPDAPVTRFHLELFGGKRGLIILSAGLCKSPKATVSSTGRTARPSTRSRW